MLEPRKASEILLNVEAKIIKLEEELRLSNSINKLIVDKLNVLLGSLGLSDDNKVPTEQNIIIAPPMETENEFKGARRIDRPNQTSTKASNSDIEFKEYIAKRAVDKTVIVKEFGAPKDEPKKNLSTKKIPITQKIQDNNSKDIFNAEVNILGADGQLVLKTRTNAVGKWQAQLSPGTYRVTVVKMNIANSKKMEVQETFLVPEDANASVMLKPLIMNRDDVSDTAH
jgi:hypothetical protein